MGEKDGGWYRGSRYLILGEFGVVHVLSKANINTTQGVGLEGERGWRVEEVTLPCTSVS